jgi:hypothetical protein
LEKTGGVIGSSGIVKDLHIGDSHIGDHEGLIYIDESDGSTCYLGAIAGINNGTVVGCSNKITVSGDGWEYARIGGIVGENSTGAKIQHCYNLGEVYSSKSNHIGGVVGNNYGVVQNCFMRSTATWRRAYPSPLLPHLSPLILGIRWTAENSTASPHPKASTSIMAKKSC